MRNYSLTSTILVQEYPSPRRGAGSPAEPFGGPDSGPEAMSEKNIREAASAIDVFGLPLVSLTWFVWLIMTVLLKVLLNI